MANNYRTLNNRLLRRIGVAKSPKAQKRIANKIFDAYEKKLSKNSQNFFKGDEQASKDFNKYTIATIRNRVFEHIDKGKFDEEVLRGQLNRLVVGSRDFQEQNKRIKTNEGVIANSNPDSTWKYNITHPTKNNSDSDHDPRCLANSKQGIFSKSEALYLTSPTNPDKLPRHKNCTCNLTLKTAGSPITSKSFSTGNF